jgi:hypothetical protein
LGVDSTAILIEDKSQNSVENVTFKRYARADIIDPTKLINELVGQVDRIEKYPSMGFTEPVKVPPDIIAAKHELIDLGFVQHLVPESRADA